MKLWHLSAIAVAAALSACATQQPAVNPALQQQLDQAQAQNNQLQSQNAQLHAQLQQTQKPQQPAETQSGANTAISLVPPNAEPGECFAKVDTPAVYKTSTSKLLKSAASTRVVTTQPQYGWTTQRIMVQPEITKLVAVPATYKMATQRVLVSAAHDKWVPGQGAIQKRAADGSLMCLVRVPAVYKTVRVRQVATAATTRSVTTPAVYKTVRVRTVVKPAGQQTVTIPATYQTVSHTNLTKAATVEWSRVVCHDNANSSLITQVQNALKKNGFNPGPIDGLFGPLTAGATNRYDKAHGLATNGAGVITYQTLDSLGVKHSS